jgi:hypothetical protein
MLTLKKLKIFQKYHGDGDAFVRAAKNKELLLFEDSDWMEVGSLYQDAKIIKNGLVAESYRQEILKRMENLCDDKKTMQYLLEMEVD